VIKGPLPPRTIRRRRTESRAIEAATGQVLAAIDA